MWRRTSLVLAALVGGFGIAASTVVAPAGAAPAPVDGRNPASASRVAAPSPDIDPEPGTAVASCRAAVVIAGQWAGGFYGQVTVYNTGSVPIRWQVLLNFPGATINPPPGYVVIQQGTSWLIYPPPSSWSAILPVGASTSFGFTGTTTGSLGTPTVKCTATPA